MPPGLTDAQLIDRLERMERNLQLLASNLGIELEDPASGVDPDITELARSGDRMRAAKLYAERTGADFVTAQGVVNSL
jgi:hypothetical protein